LKIAGETFLSAATYVPDGWGVASGVKATADPIPVTLRTVWKLDTKSSKGVLTKQYPTFDSKGVKEKYDYKVANKPVYTDTSSGCTLTNAVKEVFYTVQSVPTPIEQIGY